MPKGPRGESRPTDPVSAAMMSMRIATGQITEKEATVEVASARKKRAPRPSVVLSGETKR